MGCDIHLHVEFKVGGRWEHYARPYAPRNYTLFSKMAGVRRRDDEDEPIAEPRGLPSDLSTLTALFYEDEKGDAHSQSWLSWDEIKVLREWLAGLDGWNSAHGSMRLEMDVLGCFLPEEDEDIRARIEDIRFVFWFDN
jgi:hypothetical protein